MELNKIHNGDAIELMKQLDKNSIDFCMTSPPYWGLRDYGVEGQIGLEEHPKQYIEKMSKLFLHLKHALKKTGSFYLNVGDTYFGSGKGIGTDLETCKESYIRPSRKECDKAAIIKYCLYCGKEFKGKKGSQFCSRECLNKKGNDFRSQNRTNWLQQKQLMLMPSRLAITLQEDGWILRNDIIWHKPNPMPSSVKDRLNTTYEHLFHFVKSKNYYYNLDVIREPHQTTYEPFNRRVRNVKAGRVASAQYRASEKELKATNKLGAAYNGKFKDKMPHFESVSERKNYERQVLGVPHDLATSHPLGKNPGDFFTIPTQPFPEAHFAVYPEALCEKPIKSSCPEEGTCLDPFTGSGTTWVALKKYKPKAKFIGFELNNKYIDMAYLRVGKRLSTGPLLNYQ